MGTRPRWSSGAGYGMEYEVKTYGTRYRNPTWYTIARFARIEDAALFAVELARAEGRSRIKGLYGLHIEYGWADGLLRSTDLQIAEDK